MPDMTNYQADTMLPLTTERLILRRLDNVDAHAMAAYRNDPEVARYQSWERCSLAEAKTLITEHKNQPFGRPGEWIQAAIALRSTNQLVGDVAMKLQRHDPRQAIVGFTVARNHQRRGYAREILSAVFDHFFLAIGLHRVSADCDPRNAASWRLMESLGMRREAHHLRNLWFKGDWADEYIYAVLREEWIGRRP
jgi:RimJ/RimL family protein N-acetyltransferase